VRALLAAMADESESEETRIGATYLLRKSAPEQLQQSRQNILPTKVRIAAYSGEPETELEAIEYEERLKFFGP
jgi:hypothetical protein